MRMAIFIDREDKKRIAVCPTRAVLVETRPVSLIYLDEHIKIDGTFDEAIAELNAALNYTPNPFEQWATISKEGTGKDD